MDVEFLKLPEREIAVYSMEKGFNRPNILIAPGMTRTVNFGFYPCLMKKLYSECYNVFFVEPTGFGQSSDYTCNVSVDIHVEDIRQARDHARITGTKSVYFIGHSYSCALAAAAGGFEGMIFADPVFNFNRRKGFFNGNNRPRLSHEDNSVEIRHNGCLIRTTREKLREALDHNFIKYSQSISSPVVVIEAELGNMKSASEIDRFMDNLAGRKMKDTVTGADHNFTGYETQVTSKIVDWLEGLVD